MRLTLGAVLLAASVILIATGVPVWAHTDVTPAEARELIDSTPDLLVVDVREPFEYCDARGHIPGAVNYPLNSGVLQARYEELPMDRPILVVCRSGGRSNVAANFLDSQGFGEVYDMNGGMNAWLGDTVPCKYAGGSGTPDDPYQIATAADLIALGADPNDYGKHFILTADIDLDPNLPDCRVFDGAVIAPHDSGAESSFLPPEFQGAAFSGTFDGNGYTVANLTIDGGTGAYLGLFGSVTSAGAIRGLTLEHAAVIGREYVGGLAAYNEGSVSNCQVACYLQGEGFAPWRFGGLIAFNAGSIDNCRVTGAIWGLDLSGYFGGLVGWNEGTLADSRVHVDIAGGATCWEIGGLVGDNRGPISNCHASGTVTVGDNCRFVSGLVGLNQTVTIANSSATGNVMAGSLCNRVAGLVGGNLSGAITFCYATGDVGVADNSWGLGGLAGDHYGTVGHCWASGGVSSGVGGSSLGGLVGLNWGSVTNSYAAGTVSGGDNAQYLGALIGRGSGSVEGCFWDEETSGPIGSAGGQGLTTAEMQTAATFIDAGWDFVGEAENGTDDIWKIAEGLDYPHLWWEKYGGGTGEPNDPYLIHTAEHLNAIGADPNDWDQHFKVMADIDLGVYSETGFNIIGGPGADAGFKGVFEGNGHTISNLTLTVSTRSEVGLFGYVQGAAAEIRNVRVIEPTIHAENSLRVGALAGGLEEGKITNCSVEGAVVYGGQFTGGLVGASYESTIVDSSSTGTVVGGLDTGGLVGGNCDGTIKDCHAHAEITGESCVGGLTGFNGAATVANCHVSGSVTGAESIGGLVGQNEGVIFASFGRSTVTGDFDVGGLVGTNFAGIVGSYSAGSVSGQTHIGGLVGYNDAAEVTSSFWDTQTSGLVNSAAGTGLTTAEMQTASTFLEAGWDFVGETENGTEDIWWIDEGQDYPRLWWEAADAEF